MGSMDGPWHPMAHIVHLEASGCILVNLTCLRSISLHTHDRLTEFLSMSCLRCQEEPPVSLLIHRR